MPSVEQMNNLIFKNNPPHSYISKNQHCGAAQLAIQQSGSVLVLQIRALCVFMCACVLAGRVSEQIIQPLKRLHSEEVHPELMSVSQTLSSIHSKKSIFVFRTSTDTHKHTDLCTKKTQVTKLNVCLACCETL